MRYVKIYEDFDGDSRSDCREETGIAVGLVDGIIADLRCLRRDYAHVITEPAMVEALRDLSDDEDLKWLLEFLPKQDTD